MGVCDQSDADDRPFQAPQPAPIRVGDGLLGVLNVYSRDAGEFLIDRTRFIELIAEVLGAIIHHAEEEKRLRDLSTQLEEAITSRMVIEQARGVLMAQYRCTAEDAFARLAAVSAPGRGESEPQYSHSRDR